MVALTSLIAGSARADWQGRTEVGLEWKPAKRWQLGLSEQLRVGTDVPDWGRWLTEISVDRRIAGPFHLGLAYRVSLAGQYGGLHASHRFALDARLAFKVDDARFGHRLRLQQRLAGDADGDLEQSTRVRNRTFFRWRTPWVEPGIAFELFSDVSGNRTAFFDRARLIVGVRVPIEQIDLDVDYMLDFALDDDADTVHIVGLTATYQLDTTEDEAPEDAAATPPAR